MSAPPHNLEAERSVLGGLFIKPAAFDEVATTLQVDDFFLPAHREIFATMLAITGKGAPLDVLTVADDLRVRGMIARLDGGEVYLLTLSNSVPTAENIGHYARLVKEKATLRRLVAACAEIQSRAGGDFGDFEEFVDEARIAIPRAIDACRPRAKLRQTPADMARALGALGPATATGFATLDLATRGGFRPGLVGLGGAPGAGKTLAMVQLALRWAMEGHHVTLVAADEAPRGLVVRLGQQFGLDRAALEAGNRAATESLASSLEALPHLAIVDGDDGTTVESAVDDLIARAVGGRAFLLVDSIQTVAANGTRDADGPRARVDAVVTALKAAAKRGVVVVATCELARGAYRSRRPEDRIDDLAAFKESGGIEYGVDLALVLRSVAGCSDLVDVSIPKSRWGQKLSFRLRLNFQSATFAEEAMPPGPAPSFDLNTEAQHEADVEAVREALHGNPGTAGRDQLCSLLRGMAKGRARAAVSTLDRLGEVENRGTMKRPRLYLATEPAGVAPNPPHPPGGLHGTNPPESPRPYRGATHAAGSVAGAVRDDGPGATWEGL